MAFNQIYPNMNNNIPNNLSNKASTRQNINYIYNKCNQNIDHLRDNFNVQQRPINLNTNRKNYNRNSSKEISSILNNENYINNFSYDRINNNKAMNPNISADNSSNNYYNTNYSNFKNEKYTNDNYNDINRRSLYSNYYNRNNGININNNTTPNKNYPSTQINYQSNTKGNEVINFNGINYNIGTNFNNNLKYNNNKDYENKLKRSSYSNKSENLNIGNNIFNINLSSVTSQDIFKSYEIQIKENERKRKAEYYEQLNKQVQEKNKRKELEKQKKLQEDLKYEQKFEDYYKKSNKTEIKDDNIKQTQNFDGGNKNIRNKLIDENNMDKNIISTTENNSIGKTINDNKDYNNIYYNLKKKYNTIDKEQYDRKMNSMVKSGINIIEGNQNNNNTYRKKLNLNNNNNNNFNDKKKDNVHQDTEEYLDKIIKKTDLLTETIKNTQNKNDEQRIKEIIKVLDNNKADKNNIDNNSYNKYTPVKKYSEQTFEEVIKNINDKINPPLKTDLDLKIQDDNKKHYYQNNTIDNPKYKKKTFFDDEPKNGMTKLIATISKENNDNIKEDILQFLSERKKDKKYLIKDDMLSIEKTSKFGIKNDKLKKIEEVSNDYSVTKDSLNSNMKLTFGENGNLRFSNNNNNKQASESNEQLKNISKDVQKSIKNFTFGENFTNKNGGTTQNSIRQSKKSIKIEKIEEGNCLDDSDDEEKYDIKVNSENDINYDNMLKKKKKSDLKFLDMDKFCDVDNESCNNDTKNKNNKINKVKTNLEMNEDDLCNIIPKDEGNDKEKNKLTESKIQNQLNFFSDSINKGISHRRNDKSIFNKSQNKNEEEENDNSDIDKKRKDKIDEELEEMNEKKNELDDSCDLKDSYAEGILKNLEKYRGVKQ